MSHFAVLVIGDDPKAQLAPYQENNMGDCPREYLKFEDETEKLRKNWETEFYEVIVIDGEYFAFNDNRFRVEIKQEGFLQVKYVIPDDLERRQVSVKELYPTFDAYAEAEFGEKDEETGKYGYWNNPNSKWDYYRIGGRWTGYFKLKEETEGSLDLLRIITGLEKSGRADFLFKKDVDIEGMRKEAADRAGQKWEKFHAVVKGRSWDSFEKVREMFPEDIDAARDYYHTQSVIEDLMEADFEFWNNGPEQYLESKADFMSSAAHQAIAPAAFVINGKWVERGEMGSWGIVYNGKDGDTWAKEFNDMFDALPDDTLLTLVDCHI